MNNENNSKLNQETADKLVEIAKRPVLRIRNSQIAAGITGTIGLIIFALGIENFINTIPGLQSPLIEVVIGILLLIISGLFLKKLI